MAAGSEKARAAEAMPDVAWRDGRARAVRAGLETAARAAVARVAAGSEKARAAEAMPGAMGAPAQCAAGRRQTVEVRRVERR